MDTRRRALDPRVLKPPIRPRHPRRRWRSANAWWGHSPKGCGRPAAVSTNLDGSLCDGTMDFEVARPPFIDDSAAINNFDVPPHRIIRIEDVRECDE